MKTLGFAAVAVLALTGCQNPVETPPAPDSPPILEAIPVQEPTPAVGGSRPAPIDPGAGQATPGGRPPPLADSQPPAAPGGRPPPGSGTGQASTPPANHGANATEHAAGPAGNTEQAAPSNPNSGVYRPR